MIRIAIFSMLFPLMVACGGGADRAGITEGNHDKAAEAEFERGPHNGRMLRDGDFAIEVTIFETGVPPQFRLYAYQGNKPLPAAGVTPKITLKRHDGEINTFAFKPEGDHLTGSGTVYEPHSFDVTVEVEQDRKQHRWAYASYEGRTTISATAAKDAGVKIETAGPAVIRDTVALMGTVALDSNRHVEVKARFPGTVRAVPVQQGQRVRRGQTLVVVEGNESMRSYPVLAPFDGIVLARHTNVGDAADANALIELADLSSVWVELRAIGADAERLSPGQEVRIASATGESKADGRIETLLPMMSSGQSVVTRVPLSNPDGKWRPGMTVTATVTIDERPVPLAVEESALQRFRDFTVVFAQVGDTYEVRMLELGDRDGKYAEVLSGLKPGTRYVTEQSYLIRADIEKSGASHDH